MTCPDGYYADEEGTSECQICPGGYKCKNETGTPQICPRGYAAIPGSHNCTICPIGKYASSAGSTYCLDCPIGYKCNSRGTYSPQHCPIEKYTSYNNSICEVCPAGYYCPVTYHTSYQLYQAGTYSVEFRQCDSGYYCPLNTTTPIECPAMYYCPLGTATPKPCYRGTYCDGGDSFPLSCPLGTYGAYAANSSHYLYYSAAAACLDCPPGTYGTDPDRLTCYAGTPGYVFTGGASVARPTNVSSEGGYICPAGHYCPASSASPTACPLGTYQQGTGKTNVTSCLSCPAGYYSDTAGTTKCFACSSSSTSLGGGTSCECIGQNRAFQSLDGWCVCKPGYEFVDSNLITSSDNDGSYDCQPVVYDRCSTGYIRNALGACVTENVYCTSVCGVSGGALSETTGTCECTNVILVDEVCNSTCRANALAVTCNDDGMIVITNPVTGIYETISSSALITYGSFSCGIPGSKILSLSTSNGKFEGYFGLGTALASIYSASNVSSSRRLSGSHYSSDGHSRRLESSSSVTIDNPILCIDIGDTLVFDISNSNYPIYVKDSLLNTNGDFDYSQFRYLETLASSSLTMSTFSFTFTDAGTYVFQLSSASDTITIISVMNSYSSCPTESFSSFTVSSMVTLGVITSSSIILGPDWSLIIGLVLGMLGLILLTISFLYFFRKSAWASHIFINQKYKKENKVRAIQKTDDKFDVKKSKGILGLIGGGADMEASLNEKYDDLFDEDMLLPDLAKHIQSQHDDIDKKLINQGEYIKTIQSSLTSEVDELKALLKATLLELSNGGPEIKLEKLRSLLRQLLADCANRSIYDSLSDTKIAETIGLFDNLIYLMNNTAVTGDKAVDYKDRNNYSATIASLIYDELRDAASEAFQIEIGGSDNMPEVKSDFVAKLFASLDDLTSAINVGIKECIEDEERRLLVAENSFHKIIEANNLVFPLHLSEDKKPVDANDLLADKVIDSLSTLLHEFAEKIPKFKNIITKCEQNISSYIAKSLKSGKPIVSSDNREETIKAYLEELNSALFIISTRAKEVSSDIHVKKAASLAAREHFSAALENELNVLGTRKVESDITKALAPLLPVLAALEQTSHSMTQQQLTTQQQLALQQQMLQQEAEARANAFAASQISDNVMDAILSNDDLSDAQKEKIIDNTQQDLKILDNLLEQENRARDDAIRQAIEESETDALMGSTIGTLGITSDEEGAEETRQLRELHEKQLRDIEEQFRKKKDAELAAFNAQLAAEADAHTDSTKTDAFTKATQLLEESMEETMEQKHKKLMENLEKRRKKKKAEIENQFEQNLNQINDSAETQEKKDALIERLRKEQEEKVGSLDERFDQSVQLLKLQQEGKKAEEESEASLAAKQAEEHRRLQDKLEVRRNAKMQAVEEEYSEQVKDANASSVSAAEKKVIIERLSLEKKAKIDSLQEEHMKSLEVLQLSLDGSKDADHKKLMNSLDKRRQEKKRQLLEEAVAEELKKVQEEYENKINTISTDVSTSEEDHKKTIKVLNEDRDNRLKELQEQHDISIKILESGLESVQQQEKVKLLSALQKRKALRDKQLEAGKLTAEKAAEADDADKKKLESLESTISRAQRTLISKVVDQDAKDLSRAMAANYESAVKDLEASIISKRKAEVSSLQSRLNTRKVARLKDLAAEGKTKDDAKAQVIDEFKEEEKAELAKLKQRLLEQEKVDKEELARKRVEIETAREEAIQMAALEEVGRIKFEQEKERAVKAAAAEELLRVVEEQEREEQERRATEVAKRKDEHARTMASQKQQADKAQKEVRSRGSITLYRRLLL